MANNIASRLANRPGVGFNTAAFAATLDTARTQRGMSWRKVAAEVGLAGTTLTRIYQGHAPDATSLVRLMAWLGVSDISGFVTPAPDPTTTGQGGPERPARR